MAIVGIPFVLAACAGSPTQYEYESEPPRDSKALAEELKDVSSEMLTEVINDKARLADLDYALSIAAARYCGEVNRPRIGALVGGNASLQHESLREAAQRDHAIAGNLTVLHVVAGGPSDRAGLKPGDEILRFHGIHLKTRTELVAFLNANPGLAVARARIGRGSEERDVEIELKDACPVLFELGSGPGLTPWQHGKLTIVVPRGLIRYASEDDVLAVALGHQLAHVLFDRAVEEDLAAERRADRMGAIIAANAGYRVSGVTRYWEDAARAYPWLITPERGRPVRVRKDYGRYRFLARRFQHHDIARRMQGMRAVVAEIEAQLPVAVP